MPHDEHVPDTLLRTDGVADIESLGFRTDLAVGLAEGAVLDRRDGYRVIRTPANPTFYWGNFLLLDAPPVAGTVDGWISAFTSEFPGASHVAIGVDGTDGAAGDPAELEAAGITVDRSRVLTARKLAAPRHPNEDAELRMLDVDSDDDWTAALELKIDNEEKQNDDFEPYARRFLESKRGQQAAGNGAWFGAFLDGRMVSGLGIFAFGRADDPGGRVARYQTVDTHPEYRKRGLAGSLVHLAGRYAFERLGAHTLVIVADPDYHAIGLYRSLGFAESESQVQLARY